MAGLLQVMAKEVAFSRRCFPNYPHTLKRICIGFWFLTNQQIAGNLSGKIIDPKFNNIQTKIFNDLQFLTSTEYLADEVKIEVSVRLLKIPFTSKSVQSILYEVLPNKTYEETPFPVSVAEPRKTFLEKIFLLHEEFIKPEKTKMRTLRMSRQLYDLGKMMDAAIDKEALTDKELYNILIRHRAWYIRISWMDYATLQPDTMKGQIIYGEAEEFGRLIERLMTLNENFPNTGK